VVAHRSEHDCVGHERRRFGHDRLGFQL
jgi:hypothetical protein